MNRIDQTFRRLAGKKALIAYITAGDPDLDTTVRLMHTLADNGCDIIELGVPFSDPMADGPTIQRAAQRAVDKGVSLTDVLHTAAQFRTENTGTPIVLMGYLNPFWRMGYAEFAARAQKAGVDGVLAVDYPVDMADDFSGCLKAAGLHNIFLVAPTTDEKRMEKIAARAGGFIYYVSLKGVTGAALPDTDAVVARIGLLKKHTDLPVAVGFGIRDAQTAARIAPAADGIVVGSRFVEIIEQHPGGAEDAVAQTVRELKSAL